jgi:hypothetical protein
MKFIIALIILFEGNIKPDIYRFSFNSFLNLESCNAVLEKEKEFFIASVEEQFERLGIQKYVYKCMTLDEFKKLSKQELGA